MNFSVVIDDIELGITHIIRAKDHMDNAKKQEYVYKYLKKPVPETIFVGRINFEDLKISCSETRKLIEYGKYTDWDDIRLPFLLALKRRGYHPEAFINYALDVGVTQNDKTVSKEEFFKALNHFNKEIIETIANRYFFVWDPVEIKIENAPEQKIEIELHPDFPKRGKRIFKTNDKFYISKDDFKQLKQGKLYRLMDCLNFVKKGKNLVFDSLEYENFKKKGERIMHWLPVSNKLLKAEVLMPGNTFKKGIGEEGIAKVKEDQIVQLERLAFVKCDKKEQKKLVFWYCHR